MIKYTPQNQLSLELFKHPFESELGVNNRWVVLAKLVPWNDLANVYCSKLDATSGRKSVDVRTVIAALIVKHKLKLDDRGTVDMIAENLYLQYFCGLKAFTTKPVFDASLFVDIRKRMGGGYSGATLFLKKAL
ncbi:Transposase domain [Saccharicrinis carchari]|uniref:Transposase domain n=1 Tax=Saccharicrinis carchari TaxID=1168039 RepID=A0A521F587_SACCC|nr:transposase [Saccharicrinis carchari]SMO91303.1 Transposase domain [Saccharicrinis carchari]